MIKSDKMYKINIFGENLKNILMLLTDRKIQLKQRYNKELREHEKDYADGTLYSLEMVSQLRDNIEDQIVQQEL